MVLAPHFCSGFRSRDRKIHFRNISISVLILTCFMWMRSIVHCDTGLSRALDVMCSVLLSEKSEICLSCRQDLGLLSTYQHCFLLFSFFLWQLMFSMRLTMVKKVEQDFKYANVRGWFVMVSSFWSMFISSSLFVFMKHRSACFSLFWYVVCIQSEVCVLCAFTIEWTTSNQEPSFHIWENSMSGMHHLIRLLHMMKHHVTNIQSWKFSVPPLISNHLR